MTARNRQHRHPSVSELPGNRPPRGALGRFGARIRRSIDLTPNRDQALSSESPAEACFWVTEPLEFPTGVPKKPEEVA